ncbi:MAG: aspartate aminotransferase family protein [Parcubacteria group bacterium]|nr:aspartate aminotransferase family protein [Parcubacteria group bacterium]
MPKTPDEIFEETFAWHAKHLSPAQATLLRFAGFESVADHAQGCIVWDVHGREYLDFQGCYGALTLGHCHPLVVAAVEEQLHKMPLPTHMLFNRPKAELAALLAEITPGNLQYTFFCNSGAEAVEGAIKLARAATGRTGYVTTINSFHGKTMGALSVSGRERYQKPFEPLIPDVSRVPFGDPEALERVVGEKTAAVILEPIQGEGGVIIPPGGYLRRARKICDTEGALLIIDEVQTGFGRTGRLFGCDHDGVVPDIIALAKALGGGVMPIGAIVARPEAWKIFKDDPYIHTSTFGGNPLACAAGLAAVKVTIEGGLPERARALGERLLGGLKTSVQAYPHLVTEVRGRGLMVGVEFVSSDHATAVLSEMALRRILTTYSLNRPEVMRLAPPLIVTEDQIDRVVEAFSKSLAAVDKLLHE